jgi:hypothetical protein
MIAMKKFAALFRLLCLAGFASVVAEKVALNVAK